MRLEQHVNAPEPAQAGAVERGADLGGVVSVIVHHGDAAFLAAQLEAAIDAAEGSQPFADGVGLDFEFHGDGDGGHGIEHVVAAGDAQREPAEIGGAIADTELADKRAADDIAGLDIGLSGGAVGDGAAADLGGGRGGGVGGGSGGSGPARWGSAGKPAAARKTAPFSRTRRRAGGGARGGG